METFSALLALCEGDPSITCDFSSQRPVVFYDVRLKKTVGQAVEMPVIWGAKMLIATSLQWLKYKAYHCIM